MIYSPYGPFLRPIFVELRNFFSSGLTVAALTAASDFVQRENKPWQYYAGVLAGGAVAAAGTPGASLTLYVTSRALDVLLLKSPEGAGFDLFVDGIAAGSFSTHAADTVWETVRLTLGADLGDKKVEVRSWTTESDNPLMMNWLAIGAITLVDGGLQQRAEVSEAPPWQVVLTWTDARGRKVKQNLYYPYTFEMPEIEQKTRDLVTILRGMVDGAVISASVSRSLELDADETQGSASAKSVVSYTVDNRWRGVGKARLSFPTWRENLVTHSSPERNRVRSRPALGSDNALRAFLEGTDDAGGLCDARGMMLNRILKSEYKLGK